MLDEDYPILLSIQQAGRKIGKSEKTIRRWIQSDKLQAKKLDSGEYLIKREDLTALTRHEGMAGAKRTGHHSAPGVPLRRTGKLFARAGRCPARRN